LHDTFPQPDVGADDQNARRATLTRYAYGAFTAGAEVEGEPTILELDLAELPKRKVPSAFAKA
jgi:prokaryotic YEATS domain